MERRISKRIALEVPLKAGTATAVLRDISATGVYFITSGTYQVGEKINFSFEMKHAVPERPLHLCFFGHVTRMECLGDKTGIAATIEKYSCLN